MKVVDMWKRHFLVENVFYPYVTDPRTPWNFVAESKFHDDLARERKTKKNVLHDVTGEETTGRALKNKLIPLWIRCGVNTVNFSF